MKKRIITALLLASMLLTMAVSCGSGDTAAETTAAPVDTETAETAETTAPRIDPKLPEKDFEGYNFRVLGKGTTNVHWKTKDIAAEEENGEPINDAVFRRNSVIGEKYNFTIEDVAPDNYNDIPSQAAKVVLAGDNEFDMFSFNVASLIKNNYLYNLYDIPYMDLSQPYYDQNLIDSLTIADKLFAVAGEMIIMDNEATLGTTFNKKIAADYGVAEKYNGTLYEVVEDGRWTLDVFNEIASLTSGDLNGDGVMTDTEDQWGFQTENGNYLLMFIGAGGSTARINSDGYPESTLFNEKVIEIVNKVYDVQNAGYAINATTISSKYSDVWSECIDKNFIEGRAMFSIAGLNRVSVFRSMEVDFGILPVPKFNEAQDQYRNPVSINVGSYIAVPATAVEVERTGIIIEALSCESMYVLTPAFYDVTLEGKAIRDEESSAMLDLIFSNRVFDLGHYFGFGSVTSIFYDKNTFASQLAAKEAVIQSDIEAVMKVILGE